MGIPESFCDRRAQCRTLHPHSRALKLWPKSARPGFVAQASSVDQSVPPSLYAGPEHLIVKIDAAVAQRLLEAVQHALPAGIRQGQLGVDDLLFRFARM